AYAGSSTAFPPWPNHPGREAYPDRKKQGFSSCPVSDSVYVREVLKYSPRGISYDQAVVENSDSVRFLEKREPI
ncbi:unnamed protein product, partial [Ascophyllum nodosum]